METWNHVPSTKQCYDYSGLEHLSLEHCVNMASLSRSASPPHILQFQASIIHSFLSSTSVLVLACTSRFPSPISCHLWVSNCLADISPSQIWGWGSKSLGWGSNYRQKYWQEINKKSIDMLSVLGRINGIPDVYWYRCVELILLFWPNIKRVGDLTSIQNGHE